MTQIQVRRGTSAFWTAENPTLATGEPGYETDTGRFKFGNGVLDWVSLPYAAADPILPYTSTALLDGGALTVNADPTKFDVAETTVSFFDDYTYPVEPSQALFVFPAQTGVSIPGIGTRATTHVGYDASGTLVQSATPFTPEQRRSIVGLGVLVHTNLTTINVTNPLRQDGLNPLNQLIDLMNAIGPMNLLGNRYFAPAANLTIARTGGTMFKRGAGLNELDPHTVQIAASAIPITNLRYRTRVGEVTGDLTNVVPGSYDNAGVVTAVPGTNFTIQRIFLFSSGLTRIQYGQQLYANIDDALQNAGQEYFTTEANMSENGLIRALLVVRGNATDLTNTTHARFLVEHSIPGPQTLI